MSLRKQLKWVLYTLSIRNCCYSRGCFFQMVGLSARHAFQRPVWPQSSRKRTGQKDFRQRCRTVVQNLNEFWPSRWFSRYKCDAEERKQTFSNVPAAATSVKKKKKSPIVGFSPWWFSVAHSFRSHLLKKQKPHSIAWLEFGWVNDAKQPFHMKWLCLVCFMHIYMFCIHLYSCSYSYVNTVAQGVNLQTHLRLQSRSSSRHKGFLLKK